MDNDDWDIFSIVRSCNATSFTTPTTTFETPHPPEIQTTSTITSNNIISYQNTTPSCFDDFTFTQENRSVPFAPLKPTDFVELDKLMIKSNSTTTTTIPTLTTTSIPTIITTATSYPTTTITTIPTPSTNIIPTHITNINTSVHAFNQNSTFYDFPELIDLQQMQSNESIELENLALIFNPTPTTTTTTPNITTPTTTTPTSISHITTTTTSTTPTTTTITSKTTTTTTIPTPTTTSISTIITTATSSPTTNITIIPTPSANTIPTHIINNIAPTTTTPTSISPITTTTTSTTPAPIIITSKTTTHTIPTITTAMTSTSVRETNQYPSSHNFPMLVEQQIQTNSKNQVFVHKPVACIEITTAHFDRAYNHPSIPKQPPRESNLPPVIPPQNSSRVLPDTQPQQSNYETRKRKNNNQVVCYVTEDKLSEDSWAWKKYGQKPIKGSPHPRSYYRCSTFTDCFARKLVEKCKTKENTYIVTYRGEHNHNKPELNKNYVVGQSKSKPSKTRLPAVREVESSSNIKNFGLPNVAMLRFDQPESSNSQVLVDQSKIAYPKKELIETQSHAALEVGSSLNVGNKMMQFDEPESSNAQVFPSESKFPCSKTRLIGSFDDEDNVLIPNITVMSEDFLLNFNHLNKGVLFP